MDDVNQAAKDIHKGDLLRWLNISSRCFGDKGDVEDITEGN